MSWKVLANRLDEDAMLPGVLALSPGASITTAVAAANTAYFCRFTVPRPLEVDRVHIRVQTIDAADPAVDVAIYNGTNSTLEHVTGTGAITGVTTSGGRKELTLVEFVTLEPLVVYYASLSTASAGVAAFQVSSFANAGANEIVDDTAPHKYQMSIGQAPPLPATIAPSANQTNVPLVFMRERGT